MATTLSEQQTTQKPNTKALHDDPEVDEGFSFLLGGLNLEDVTADAWDQADDEETDEHVPSRDGTVHTSRQRRPVSTEQGFKPLPMDDSERDTIFAHAYQCSSSSSFVVPPQLPPVEMVTSATKGNALVTTRPIHKGDVIFTERAAVAIQVPPVRVRACQWCFRSLEPASTAVVVHACSRDGEEKDDDASIQQPPPMSLPDTDLWPVPEFNFESVGEEPPQPSAPASSYISSNIRIDQYKRLHCTDCDSWFCHKYCLQQLEAHVGNHCLCRQAVNSLQWSLREPNSPDTAAVALATRMFAMAIQQYRTTQQNVNDQQGVTPTNGWDKSACWKGLCGEAKDITALHIGIPTTNDKKNNSTTTTYSLQDLYKQFSQLWSLSPDEQEHITCHLLETFAAMAARNGFDIRTQSPFTSYYTALLRRHGGRGSSQHESIKQHVAQALGATTLERGMDRQVNDRVSADVVALMPLTARINHSCCNDDDENMTTGDDKRNETGLINAQVMSQVFVDARIDLVATRSIPSGHEILISYLGTPGALGVRNKNTPQRQEALQSKYLFQCDCPKCADQPMMVIAPDDASSSKSALDESPTRTNPPQQLMDPPSNNDLARKSNVEDLTIVQDCYCPACGGGHATSTILPMIVPAFREIVVMQLTCEECGFRNAEASFAGQIQAKGERITLIVKGPEDLNRQIVKSDTTTIILPSLDFEIPPSTQKGTISTLEGILTKAAATLDSQQAERLKLGDMENFHRCHEVIQNLRKYALRDEEETNPFPYKVLVDDPAGNSFVENLKAPSHDPQLFIERYVRSNQQNELLGLQPEQPIQSTNPKDFSQNEIVTQSSEVASDASFARDEPVVFPGHCPQCQSPTETRMCLTNIPHFKEVIIMSMVCSECGYKSNEVKGGGAIPALGRTITLRGTHASDLVREVICSDTASVSIPELELETSEGGMDGIYTTVEGLLTKLRDRLKHGNPFVNGDSATQYHANTSTDGSLSVAKNPASRQEKFQQVLEHLSQMIRGERLPYTLIITDPLANSFIGPLEKQKDDDEDSALSIRDFERSYMQNESLGLNDMRTGSPGDNPSDSTPSNAALSKAQNAHSRGPDHPHWTAKAPVEGDTTIMGVHPRT